MRKYRNIYKGIAGFLASVVFPCGYVFPQSRVLIPPLGTGPNIKAREAIADALRNTGHFLVVDLDETDEALGLARVQAERKKRLQDLEGIFTKGKETYSNLELPDAKKYFEESKVGLRSILEVEGAFELLRVVQFHLSMTYLALGEEKLARGELREVIRMDPAREDRELSRRDYPPNIRKLFEEVKKEILQSERALLKIESAPKGAYIYVDGKAEGTSPALVKNLPVGLHIIHFQLEGYQDQVIEHLSVEGENILPIITLVPLTKGNPAKYFDVVQDKTEISALRSSELDRISRKLDADLSIFLRPKAGTVAGQVYDHRTLEVSIPIEAVSPDEFASRILKQIDNDGYVIPIQEMRRREASQLSPNRIPEKFQPAQTRSLQDEISQPTQAPGLQKEKPWYLNHWVWIGVALGAGAIAGGAILLSKTIGQSGNTSTLKVTIP